MALSIEDATFTTYEGESYKQGGDNIYFTHALFHIPKRNPKPNPPSKHPNPCGNSAFLTAYREHLRIPAVVLGGELDGSPEVGGGGGTIPFPLLPAYPSHFFPLVPTSLPDLPCCCACCCVNVALLLPRCKLFFTCKPLILLGFPSELRFSVKIILAYPNCCRMFA